MKHLFKFSLLLLALLLPATALAHDFEVDGIYYNINGNEATVTYRGTSSSQYSNEYSGSVTIPALVTYGGTTYSVTSIGNSAFSRCSGLTSIDIPNSVTSISEDAFIYCSGMTCIEVENGNPNYDSRDNCNAIIETATNTLISGCQYTIIPNSVTTIGDFAFVGCSGLTSIDIPNSVTNIGGESFIDCTGLTSVTFGSSVAAIGYAAFQGCSGLNSVYITDLGAWCNIDFHPYDFVFSSNPLHFAHHLFLNGEEIKDLVIPNTVTTIKDGAFYGCSSLTSVTIGNSVTRIGDWAFFDCRGLTSVTIGNSVTTIGDWAFSDCSGLTSITIPNSVTTIGYSAFSGCSGLNEIYSLALAPPTIDSYTFYDCYGATLYVPKEAVNAYRTANYWKKFTNIVGFVECVGEFEVDGILYRAMNDGTATVIANEEMENYYTGDKVIAETVAFEGNNYVVTFIEDNAFSDCYELTSITIPNSVEKIGEQAFQGCTGLKSVTISSGVTAIGAKAFNYCNALETVKCIGTVPPIMASTDCFSTAAYNRAQLLVPRNTEATYSTTDYWYKFAHIDGWGSAGQGDVNGDGVMSIRDVTSLIDVLLGNELDSFYYDSADLNSNGRIDIGDVTSLIDNLLNGDY